MTHHQLSRLVPRKTFSKIISSGIYLPDEVAESDHIFQSFKSEKNYGIATDWMSDTMGIIERRVSREDQSPSDLAVEAARRAIDSCRQINPDDIGMVLFCGIERDQPEPATAHVVQNKLGIKADIAFDVSNACFGFVDGLRIAEQFISSGSIKYALVVTGEIPTRLMKDYVNQLKSGMDIKQAKKILGFLSVGDAGAAVIVGPSDESQADGFRLFRTLSRSQHLDKCRYSHTKDGHIEGQMLMAQIVVATLRLQFDNIPETLSELGWDHPDFFMTHQVSKVPFNAAAKLNITPKEKMIKSYDKLGNITSATFAVNHHQLMERDDVKPGDRVYCCYSGSGIVIGQFGYTI